MHDLTVNFQKMLQITNSALKQDINQMETCIFIHVSPSFLTLRSLHCHCVRNTWESIVRIGF
ncbi:MAG: hypothetical protein JWP45_2828 [Mucilaginibacter sp.]|nr:hypothetical protein [Mucilaginibacter sp.]